LAKKSKSPPEKKRLSLAKDRRNSYGENDKSSRKNISLSKALSHRAVRRKSASLEQAWEGLTEAEAEARELTLVTPRLQKGKFRKSPDIPLAQHVASALTQRRRRQSTSKPD
jgi:hypothetical protein